MYQIFWDKYILHDARTDQFILKSPSLTEEVNKIAELTFNIYPEHPYFNKLEKLVPNIILKKEGRTIFKGRIIKDKQLMNNSKQVTCEGVLAFLLDSVQRPFEFQGKPAQLFTQFINNHNEQVEDYKKFKIGKLTGANLDTNDYINRSSEEYLDTFSAIESRLLSIGGYIQVRYEEDGLYIDWLDDFAEGDALYVSTQTIEFGENLIDIVAENDASETYSVVIPLGAEIEPEPEEETAEESEDETTPKNKKRLTIESVNDGKDYLVNDVALEKYGWIVAPLDKTTWDDVTLPDNLKTKAQKFLNDEGITLKSTIELNAIDLNVIDGKKVSFKMGEYIRVKSTPHNISKVYLLTKKVTPLTNPENMKITLGETQSTFTGIQMGDQQDTINKVENILGDYVLNEDVTNIVYESIENSSIIKQLPNEILSQVSQKYSSKSELEQLEQILKTTMSQTESGWLFEFNKIIEQITNIDGTVNSNYQELIKYIRFVDGKIVLGVVGNDITLVLSNDRLSFFQNNTEVAYMSNGKLYITDAELLNSLIIGNFSFIPRTNGNLSFKKVRGD